MKEKPPIERLEEYLGNRAKVARKSGFNSDAKNYDEQLQVFRVMRQALEECERRATSEHCRKYGGDGHFGIATVARTGLGK